MKKNKLLLLLCLLALLLLYGCGLDESGREDPRKIWLDGPLHTTGLVGQPVALSFHANFFPDFPYVMYYNRSGSSYLYGISEVIFHEYTPELYEANGVWIPAEPGTYNLRGCDGSLRWCSNTRSILISSAMIYEPPAEGGEPTPTRSAFEPVPVGELDFSADVLNLAEGNCTYLRWTSSYMDEVFLDGETVGLSGAREVCPGETTAYTLEGLWSGGSKEEMVTINVIEQTLTAAATPTKTATLPPVIVPSDTPVVIMPSNTPTPTLTPTPVDVTGPTLSNMTQSETSIYDGTTCGVTSNTIQVKATDPSGISKVQITYWAIRSSPAETGSWQTINMTGIGGGVYEAVLGIHELTNSLSLYADGTVEFYIKAWDGKNNVSQSSTYTFSTLMCFG